MERDKYWDSLKFILIVLVVFGHMLEVLGNAGTNKINIIIYSFHMPLFIFISGFFSKKVTLGGLKKNFITLLPAYLIFQFLLYSPEIINGEIDWYAFLVIPRHALWYIPALLLWRVAAFLIPKTKIPPFLFLLLSIAISLTMGFYDTREFYILGKGIFFAPFFMLGYLVNKKQITYIRNINKYIVATVFIVSIALIYNFANIEFVKSTRGIILYKYLFPENHMLALYYRISFFVVAIIMSICVLNLTPSKFHRWGNKTFDIYLLHGIFLYLIYNSSLSIQYGFYKNLNIFSCVIVTVITLIACIGLSYLKPVQYLVNPVSLFQKNKS